MRSHEVDYKIYGDDLQFVEIELDRGETVIAEAGMMMYIEQGMTFETRMGDGSKPNAGFLGKVANMGARLFTGESLFMTHFTYQGEGKGHAAFAAPYPGQIVSIDLDTVGNDLLCQKDSFLCAALGTEVTIALNKRFGSGLFGGEGFILQRLRGDGLVFVHAGGTVVERQLNGGKIMVDTGCIVAFEAGIDYNIERAGNLKSMLFGGEGIFLATLQGTGRVWLQSLPFSRLADRILKFAPSQGGQSQGEGSVVKGLTNLLQQ